MEEKEILAGERLSKLHSEVFEELSVWYGDAISNTFYPDIYADVNIQNFSDKLKQWSDSYTELYGENAPEARRISMLWSELTFEYGKLRASSPKRPDYKLFNDFSNLHHQLVVMLNKMTQEQSILNSGLDPITLLPTAANMLPDLRREQERRARHGKEFCIILLEIDSFDSYKKKSKDLANEALKYTAKVIKKIIRTFDDAYSVKGGRFVLSLKHADTAGAIACVERLRTALKGCDSMGLLEVKDAFSLTFGIAEPLAGDDLEKILESLHDALDKNTEDNDTIIEYKESSPLEEYIKNIEE